MTKHITAFQKTSRRKEAAYHTKYKSRRHCERFEIQALALKMTARESLKPELLHPRRPSLQQYQSSANVESVTVQIPAQQAMLSAPRIMRTRINVAFISAQMHWQRQVVHVTRFPASPLVPSGDICPRAKATVRQHCCPCVRRARDHQSGVKAKEYSRTRGNHGQLCQRAATLSQDPCRHTELAAVSRVSPWPSPHTTSMTATGAKPTR